MTTHHSIRTRSQPCPERITLRLGPLDQPVAEHITATGETVSEYIRRLIAEDLGEPVPHMPTGITHGGEASLGGNT